MKKIDDLSNVLHILQATANTYYNPDDKMWNRLLKPKEKLEPFIDKEIIKIYGEIKKLKQKQDNEKMKEYKKWLSYCCESNYKEKIEDDQDINRICNKCGEPCEVYLKINIEEKEK